MNSWQLCSEILCFTQETPFSDHDLCTLLLDQTTHWPVNTPGLSCISAFAHTISFAYKFLKHLTYLPGLLPHIRTIDILASTFYQSHSDTKCL